MQQVRIDFDNPGLPQGLGVVEGESQSRIFQVVLYKSGAAYTAPAGAVYSIMYRGFGPQNQGWYDTIEDGAGKRAACTVSGNVVTCELARQALRVPGHLTVVLCVSDAKGYMLKSWPIMADVRNDGYEDTGEIEMYFNLSGLAGNYLTRLEKAMADAEATKNNLISTSTQAQKDIDAKAAETLKTIPESYTELDGSVKKLKEDLAFVSDERISPSMTNFVVDGRQLFNKDGKLINGYYNNGKFVERSDMAGHFIKIKGGSNICASGAFFYGATFDANRKLIKEYLNVADGSHITIEQNAAWLYVATSTQILDQLVVSYGDDDGNPVGNYWDRIFYVDGKYIDGVTSHIIYKLPYIQNCRVKCNGGNDTVTAYYAGVDCKKTVNIIQCRWIWERGTNTGTLALIINPNGTRYIKDITASSLHLQVRNNQIKLDVLGVKYGNYYYQNIINKTLDTAMPLDNKTEHIVSLVANGNECIVTLDGTEYKGTFIPDDKITSLNEILGQYATFEHFCYGERSHYAMPQITQFIVRANDEYIIDDDFQRQDGQLQNTPQGIPYHLISTLSNRG